MSAPQEENSPKRNRIVINLEDKPQTSAPQFAPQYSPMPKPAPPPKKGGNRHAKLLGIVAIVNVVLLVGVALLAYFGWQHYKTKPAYSLALLVDAVQRNDAAGVDEIVDTNKIVDNFVPQVTEKAIGRYATGLTSALRKQVEALVPKLMPNIKQQVHDEVTAQVKELSARAEGRSFPMIALGIPYVLNIDQQDDNTAKVAVQLKDRTIELTMQRSGDERWRIVAVKDDALAARIVDNIAKELPSLAGQAEKEVKKQLKNKVPQDVQDKVKENLPQIPF